MANRIRNIRRFLNSLLMLSLIIVAGLMFFLVGIVNAATPTLAPSLTSTPTARIISTPTRRPTPTPTWRPTPTRSRVTPAVGFLEINFNIPLQGSAAGVRIDGGTLIQSYYKRSYPAGTLVTLTAVSCDSIQFVNWGYLSSTENPLAVRIYTAISKINANFALVTPTPTPGYVVTYIIQSDWGTGATVNVTIKNNTSAPVNDWTLAWTFPGNQTITNLWNGTFTQNGTSIVVKDSGSNPNIPANGGTVNFGFNMNYSGVNSKPASFTLNGTPCQIQ